MTFRPLIIILFGISFIISCSTKKILTRQPPVIVSNEVYKINSSIIQLPIEIPMDVFSRELNTYFNGLIYSDTSYSNNENDNLKLKVWRNPTPLEVEGSGKSIKLKLPINIWACYQWKACGICPSVEKSVDFGLSIAFNTQVAVSKEWKLNTQTTVTALNFLKEPSLDFGVVKIPVTGMVRKAITDNIPSITSAIDREIGNSIPLKKRLEETWLSIQDPILIDSVYQAWFAMKPLQIFLTPVQGDKKKLLISAGIETFFETRLGEKMNTPVKSFLNPPIIKDKIDHQFQIELPIGIDFNSATQMARRILKDSVFTIQRKKIVLKDIEIYGSDGMAYVKTDLEGAIKGTLYLKGIPMLDTIENQLFIDQLDFDMVSKDALINVASWLLKGTFKKMLAENLIYSLDEKLKGAQHSFNLLLNGYKYGNLFTVNGKLNDLKMKKVYCDQKGFQTIFTSTGKASVKMNQLIQ
jgi:hypothetical protein